MLPRTRGVELERNCKDCGRLINGYTFYCKKCRGRRLREKAEKLLKQEEENAIH